VRNAHEAILQKTTGLLHDECKEGKGRFPVGRGYEVSFDESKVSEDAGVWLQGCNESTHGVSLPGRLLDLAMLTNILSSVTHSFQYLLFGKEK
jgi:hypothetical protein